VSDPAIEKIERELALLGRRAERFRMLSEDGTGTVLDRSAYRLLGHLHDSGPVRLTALGAVFALDLSTVSRQVAALDTARLVERTMDPTDRRAVLIRLTAHGRERYERAQASRVNDIAELTAAWSPEDRERLGSLLARFNAAIAERERRRGRAGADEHDGAPASR
jgi:DNA-binding MarR family transcriptional regulator